MKISVTLLLSIVPLAVMIRSAGGAELSSSSRIMRAAKRRDKKTAPAAGGRVTKGGRSSRRKKKAKAGRVWKKQGWTGAVHRAQPQSTQPGGPLPAAAPPPAVPSPGNHLGAFAPLRPAGDYNQSPPPQQQYPATGPSPPPQANFQTPNYGEGAPMQGPYAAAYPATGPPPPPPAPPSPGGQQPPLTQPPAPEQNAGFPPPREEGPMPSLSDDAAYEMERSESRSELPGGGWSRSPALVGGVGSQSRRASRSVLKREKIKNEKQYYGRPKAPVYGEDLDYFQDKDAEPAKEEPKEEPKRNWIPYAARQAAAFARAMPHYWLFRPRGHMPPMESRTDPAGNLRWFAKDDPEKELTDAYNVEIEKHFGNPSHRYTADLGLRSPVDPAVKGLGPYVVSSDDIRAGLDDVKPSINYVGGTKLWERPSTTTADQPDGPAVDDLPVGADATNFKGSKLSG